MKIGGLQKLSLIDYEGELSCVIFTTGCNFRCPYCHNPELVKQTSPIIDEKIVMEFLRSRVGQLTAVVITGGEPTLQPDLVDFIKQVKSMGFKVKLDTNGSNPAVIETLLKKSLIDYIAMDIKAALNRYNHVTKSQKIQDNIKESIAIIKNLAQDYEFRTTFIKGFVDSEDLKDIVELVSGAKRYAIQGFRKTKTLDSSFEFYEFKEKELEALCMFAKRFVNECILR